MDHVSTIRVEPIMGKHKTKISLLISTLKSWPTLTILESYKNPSLVYLSFLNPQPNSDTLIVYNFNRYGVESAPRVSSPPTSLCLLAR